MLLDGFLAGGEPDTKQEIETFAFHAPAERGEVADIRDEKPAKHVFDLMQGALCQECFIFLRNFLRLPKFKHGIPDRNLVTVG